MARLLKRSAFYYTFFFQSYLFKGLIIMLKHTLDQSLQFLDAAPFLAIVRIHGFHRSKLFLR